MKPSSSGNVWARMLLVASSIGTGVAVLTAGIAVPVSGGSAAASVLLGSVIVAPVFAASLLALWWASRFDAHVAPLVMLALYALLVFAGVILLATVTVPGWVQGRWVGIGAAVQVAAWLVGAGLALRRARLPIFDVGGAAPAPDHKDLP